MCIHCIMSSLPEIPKSKKFDKYTLNIDHDRIKRNILEFCNIEPPCFCIQLLDYATERRLDFLTHTHTHKMHNSGINTSNL